MLSYCSLISAANEIGTPRSQDVTTAGQKKIQTNVRILRAHSGSVIALHCVSRREVWDLVGDREDAGFFISGSTDCLVSCRSENFLSWYNSITWYFASAGLIRISSSEGM